MNRYCRRVQKVWLCCLLLGLTCWSGCRQSATPNKSHAKKEIEASVPTTVDGLKAAASDKSALSDQASSLPGDWPTTKPSSTTQDATEKQATNAQDHDRKQPAWEPHGQWTTRRLIVLAETGPRLIDLSVSHEGKSLEQAAQEQLSAIATELFAELKPPAKWEELLELPLVRSRWLGNLIAADDQRDQLISLYDTQRDGIVSTEELPAFLSRGLSRVGPLQVSDTGLAPDNDASQSPWGKGDLDQDFSLNADELKELNATLQRDDLNGDGVITRRELAGITMQMPNMANRNRSSILKTSTLIVAESVNSTLDSADTVAKPNAANSPTMSSQPSTSTTNFKSHRKMANDVLRHYTFLAELPREQWPAWNDQQWNAFDTNQDQKLDAFELQKLITATPQAHVYVSLVSAQAKVGQASQVNVKLLEPMSKWQANETGGQLTCGSCSVRLDLTDAFSEQGKTQLRQQLNLALKNPQLQAFFVSRMQLDESAFQLIDQDEDKSLSDQEFERVWRWICGRQSVRVAGRWMLSGQPWFQLADDNADSRLSEIELKHLSQKVKDLDRNGDQLVTPIELPLVAMLTILRSDSRLENQLPQAGMDRSIQAVDSDWFSAMDTNRDGSISQTEFLGEQAEFSRLDGNQDGFLSRGELYIPKASN